MGRAEEEAKEEEPNRCGSPLLALLRRPAAGIEVAMDAHARLFDLRIRE